MENKLKKLGVFIPVLLVLLIFSPLSHAKNWKYLKEIDGIKVYSGQETNQKYKSFKGVAIVNSTSEKIFAKLENVTQTDWWTKDVIHMEVLNYKKNKLAQYYLVYQLPWPFKQRDLYVNAEAEIDQLTNEYKLVIVPLKGSYVKKNDNYVRINDFKQEWKITTINKNKAQIELEYYIDVGANLPVWLINQVLADSPAQIIKYLIKKQ